MAWTVAVNRSTSFAALALVVLVGRRGLTYRSADLRPAAVVGLLDAGANALFALALTRGMTSTVGVIGSLYPVTTVLLAAVVLRERPRPLQGLGVAGVLVGVGLVIAWAGPSEARRHQRARWRSMTPWPLASSVPSGRVPAKVPNGWR